MMMIVFIIKAINGHTTVKHNVQKLKS